MSTPALEILAAPSVSIQDAGRRGWRAYGVPVGGAMDRESMRQAIGSSATRRCLRVGNCLRPGGNPRIVRDHDCTDRRCGLLSHPLWRSVTLQRGETVRLQGARAVYGHTWPWRDNWLHPASSAVRASINGRASGGCFSPAMFSAAWATQPPGRSERASCPRRPFRIGVALYPGNLAGAGMATLSEALRSISSAPPGMYRREAIAPATGSTAPPCPAVLRHPERPRPNRNHPGAARWRNPLSSCATGRRLEDMPGWPPSRHGISTGWPSAPRVRTFASPPHTMKDINCDLGEGESPARTRALLRHATSANIACGGHAGDLASMDRCLRLCTEMEVRPGAHRTF